MKAVLEAEAAGDEDARLAVEVYLHRLRGEIARMAAALGGLDVLVFTGGVGERSAPIRARAADGLGFLGIGLDRARNAAPELDAEISSSDAAVSTFVVAAREDIEIARGVRSALALE
jgi:acetate kinase